MSARTVYVVPCFNEERRLDRGKVLALAGGSASVLLVDDGSRDGTLRVLESLADGAADRVDVLALPKNGGKAEAVRAGMRRALDRGAHVVGFADADFSTPPRELLRLVDVLAAHAELEVVLGSRVLMAGRRIERKASRHYLGRVFATLAANILRTPFYDTQCGAKLFRATPSLAAALDEPFVSRWAFDVELLGRLLIGSREPPVAPVAFARMREVPLEEWVDEPGSKLGALAMAKSAADLARIEIDLDRRRRAIAS